MSRYFLLGFCWMATAGLAADKAVEIPCQWSGVERIVAVGDIHGAYAEFVAVLQAAQIVDPQLHWIAGKTHLVQTGDVPDRGADSRQAYDLLRRLEKEASEAGGAVHALIGNHDAWMITGDLRYTVEGEFTAFATKESAARREEYRRTHSDAPGDLPLGYAEHRTAFTPQGVYGAWICQHHAVIQINDTLFCHGGLNEKYGTLPLGPLNETIRAELRGDRKLAIVEDPDSPFFFRGLAQDDEKLLAPKVDKVLAFHHARRIVIGHTVTYGPIQPRCGGRVVMIDCGMNPIYWDKGGRPAALEIKGEKTQEIALPTRK